MSTDSLVSALAEKRYETARRIGMELLRSEENRTPETLFPLHDTCIALADFHTARHLLEAYEAVFQADPFPAALRLAEDLQTLASEGHYRLSPEAKQGYSCDEYVAKYRGLAGEKFTALDKLALDDRQREALDAALVRARLQSRPSAKEKSFSESATVGRASLRGRVQWPDGSPVGGATMTLGLKTEIRHVDPVTFYTHEMHYVPEVGPLQKLTTQTDDDGVFSFRRVPAGVQDYLAVTLDPEACEIPTRFLARAIPATDDDTTDLGDIVVTDWQSAAPAGLKSPHPDSFDGDGILWRKAAEWPLHNPFYYSFRRQLLSFPWPEGVTEGSIRVEVHPGQPEPFQIAGGEIHFVTDLPARTDRVVALYASTEAGPSVSSALELVEESPDIWRIDTGVASFRIPGVSAPVEAAPIFEVKAADNVWRGEGRMVLPAGIAIIERCTRLLELGPVFLEVLIEYRLSTGQRYALRLKAVAGDPCLLVQETSPELDGAAFEFSLREFSGGRAFLHWTPEAGGRHWTDIEAKDELMARLPESVPWWIPPQGFGSVLTPGVLAENDYIGVFTLRRGEWIDRKFERIAQGPIDRDGSENRELDWPFPEMVGSSISMITTHSTKEGDAFFRFGFFDGERQWGLLASSLPENDGLSKEISALQHAYSSPRLQDFKDWHLDEADACQRPHVVVQRKQLPALRGKTKNPRFSQLWDKIRAGRVPGPSQGLVFVLEGDPQVAWKKRIELLAMAEIRAKMTLLGRDWSDIYSPVGGRPITQWAEEYDLIAASGVFSAGEERQLRAFFILMGHMFMEPDFMNWKFNARNANFEADRADIVAAVGLVFDGHPCSAKFLDHVVERTQQALQVYCTPGSGKWYENPACYYLHASKCRMNLVFHLVNHGKLEIGSISRMKEYLRWGILLLTPPQPVSYAVMRDGDGRAYERTEKVRKVPPIGDHASVGRWLPEHYFFIGKLFAAVDPDFGRELKNAYFVASGDGRRLMTCGREMIEQVGEQLFHDVAAGSSFGNLPLLFATIEESDIPQDPSLELPSRRLEGFGAVLRNRLNTPEEDYLLIKQGPGGYRYHRTEGSFLFFAEGKPLIYDGGEAGETWRHSTLSFHDVRMPLSAGRVERFFSHPAFHFVQGVHPEVIGPGEPVFLSDTCEHYLVEEAYRRFEKKNPAAVRSFAWVGGEYLVIHDALEIDPQIPSHWNLQFVGESITGHGGQYEGKGRFGVDLQVLLPDQTFADELIERVPILEYHGKPEDWFTMQHLQLSATGAKGYLAVLKPLSENNPDRVAAQRLNAAAVKVTGSNREDLLWFDRNGIEDRQGSVSFRGTYGACLRRVDRELWWLGGSGRLQDDNRTLESEGVSVLLELTAKRATLYPQGTGIVRWDGREFPVSADEPPIVL